MKSLATLVLLSAFVALASAASYHKQYNTTEALPLQVSSGATVQFNVTIPAADAYTLNSATGAEVALNIKFTGDASLTTISIQGPGISSPIILFSGFTQTSCSNCQDGNILISSLETQIDSAEMQWACRNTTGPCLAGSLKPLNAITGVTQVSGSWKIFVKNDASAPVDVSRILLIVGDDTDNDNVANNIDGCPLDENTDQADTDSDGKQDVCQCKFYNHHVLDKFERQCVMLSRFGNNDLYYQGVRKNTGDWWPVVVHPGRNRSFKPGDYSHQSQWLNCQCEALDYPKA